MTSISYLARILRLPGHVHPLTRQRPRFTQTSGEQSNTRSVSEGRRATTPIGDFVHGAMGRSQTLRSRLQAATFAARQRR